MKSGREEADAARGYLLNAGLLYIYRRRKQRGTTCWMLVYYTVYTVHIRMQSGREEAEAARGYLLDAGLLYIYECSQGERRRKQRGATCWMLVYYICGSSEGLLVECWSTVYIRMQLGREEAEAARGYLLNAGLPYICECSQGERRRKRRGATCWMLVYHISTNAVKERRGVSSEGLLVECWSTVYIRRQSGREEAEAARGYVLDAGLPYIYECSQGEKRRKQRGATCWMLVYCISTNAVKERGGGSSEGLLAECWSTVYIRMQSRREADAARG